MEPKGQFVVVTTDKDKRGVFGGGWESRNGDEVVLTHARNAIYWSKDTLGFLGLAGIGPQPGSIIGPAAPRLLLTGVTSIAECTKSAEKRWTEAAE